MHQPLAVVGPEVPQPDGLVHGAGEEGVVRGGHAQRHHALVVAAEVAGEGKESLISGLARQSTKLPKTLPDVGVCFHVEVADDVILLGGGVDHVGLSLREVHQVHPVLLGVEGSLLGALLAVVDNDLCGDNKHLKKKKDLLRVTCLCLNR